MAASVEETPPNSDQLLDNWPVNIKHLLHDVFDSLIRQRGAPERRVNQQTEAYRDHHDHEEFGRRAA